MSAVFQSTVFIDQGFGVPGEVFQDVPWIVLPWTLNSSGTPNVVGSTAYTITSQGFVQAGNGGTLGFGGILCSPKDYALYGTTGQPLSPSLVLADYTQAALLTQGMMIVQLATVTSPANIGDYVIYDDTTGALSSIPPGPACPAGFSFANAVVSQLTATVPGLAVIQVTLSINPIPTNA